MQVGDEIELLTENFTNSADGIARKDGITIFIKGACPGDKVLAKIVDIRKNFAAATVKDIITPSNHRIFPFCPLHKVCGACSMQFIDYDYQLELKSKIVEDALHSIGKICYRVPLTRRSPDIRNYRHKIQYPVSQKKNSERLSIGYYKQNSHETVNIKFCPIQPQICDEITEFIRANALKFNITGYDEISHSGILRHIIMRVSKVSGKVLLGFIINSTSYGKNLKSFADKIMNEFEEIQGVCVNFNTKKSNIILGEKTVCIAGENFIKEKLLGNHFKIGIDTFFQVNPSMAEELFTYVKNYIKDNYKSPSILDAYAGIAAIGMGVADISKSVTSVEISKSSCQMASEGLSENNIRNLSVINADTAEFIKNTNEKFDIVITDPPKKGSTKEVLDGFMRCCRGEIIYVSCNPATLARDLRYLIDKGCELKSIQPFDMFCHTPHVETVAVIKVG